MTSNLQTIVETRRTLERYDLDLLPDTLSEAYRFQDGFSSAVGDVAGYKLAANSPPQMAHFNVTEPVCARVFANQVHGSGVSLPRAGFSALSVEPEITAILGDGVQHIDAPVDQAAARGLIDRFHASFELIDLRGYVVPQMDLPHVVALNVFNAGCVLAEASIAPDALDLERLHVTVHDDGALMGETTNTPPQHPVEAVTWLLNNLHSRGLRARPGMLVMCGTHLPIRTLPPEVGTVSLSMAGLGDASFTLID